MDYKDYYSILGVSKTATKDEIKKAYRNLAKKYHPDKTQGNKALEDKFKEVSEAYEVLGNDENRKKYDELGSNWKNGGKAEGGGFDYNKYYSNQGGQGQYHTFEGDPEMFSDFFNNIFGGGYTGSKKKYKRKGQNYVAEMEISLTESYHGCTRIINVNGEKLRIKTKPGTANGQRIKLAGKGSSGINGGNPGDLLITIHVLPDNKFIRRANDLYSDLNLSLFTAVLGGKVEVPTLNGIVKMNIPKGTQCGKTLRIKGKGMPVYGKKDVFGDLYVKTIIEIPKKISEEEEKLFIKLKELQSNG